MISTRPAELFDARRSADQQGASTMTTESLTYAEIGDRLGVSPHAARALVRRLHLPRQMNNDGKAVVLIDFAEIQHKPQPTPSRPDAEHATVAALQERVAALAAELAAERERSAGYRADFERERERADHERDRANRERERVASFVDLQLPVMRNILEAQEGMAGNVATVRGLVERADSLADLQVPALRSVLEKQDGMAGDVAALHALLDHVYGYGGERAEEQAVLLIEGPPSAQQVEEEPEEEAADAQRLPWWRRWRRAA
jgi:hypothetical protein